MLVFPNIVPVEDGASIPLSGLVNHTSNSIYPDKDSVVDYVGIVTTSMKLQGSEETDAKSVVYRVGVRDGPGNISRPVDIYRINTSMAVSEEVRRAFQEMGRRASALPTTWERVDLYGIVMRLAMGIAYYTIWGRLTTTILRGGGNTAVAAIAAVVGPIAADNGSVFVSTKLVSHARPSIMAALISAVSGEGGTLYTDLLAVNQAGVIQVPDASDAALAQGCHEALRVLSAMFKACGKTAFFGLAVAEGLHKIKSLHGHTDEGAYVREVFRAGEAGLPFGAIALDMIPDNSIPTPQRCVSGFRSVYDGIAVATAGAVALADPMVSFDGKDYPTLLVTDQGDEGDPGDHNDGDASDAADLTTQWAEHSGAWALLYARALNKLFMGLGGEAEVVRRITAKANKLAGSDSRHLRCKAAVAFFWVEPTTACPIIGPEFPAAVARHGPLATRLVPTVMPALNGSALLVDRSDNTRSSIQVDFRFLRRHGLFVHLTTHSRDGMANISLDTGVADCLAMIGGAGNVGPRILAGNTLNTYQWGRGHSSLVSGGELISTSASNIITLEHTRLIGGRRARLNHLPTGLEAVTEDVHVTASSLVGSAPAAPDRVTNNEVRRSRSRASVSLSMAADFGRTRVVTNAQRMAPSLSDPGPLPQARAGMYVTRIDQATTRDEGSVKAQNPVIPASEIVGRVGVGPGGVSVINGVNAPINIENVRERGPKVPRPGGGGPPINPGGGFVGGGPGGGGGLGGGGGGDTPPDSPPDNRGGGGGGGGGDDPAGGGIGVALPASGGGSGDARSRMRAALFPPDPSLGDRNAGGGKSAVFMAAPGGGGALEGAGT
jgi:hypothetical protein